VITADRPLTAGTHTVRYEFEKDDGSVGPPRSASTGPWWPRGASSGSRRRASTAWVRASRAATSGARRRRRVRRAFACTAQIEHAVVETTGPVVRDSLAELAAILSEQ